MDTDCVPEAPYECCRTPGNVPVVEDHPDAGPDEVVFVSGQVLVATQSVRVCRVCGRRHFEMAAHPGRIAVKGSAAETRLRQA